MSRTRNQLDEPHLNPYAAPEVATGLSESDRNVIHPRAGMITMYAVCFLLRGVGFGFVTLICLVYSSGTAIHWENVRPMLLGVFIGFAGTHWFEFRMTTSKINACIFAFVAYSIGAAVVTTAGYLQYFPTPF